MSNTFVSPLNAVVSNITEIKAFVLIVVPGSISAIITWLLSGIIKSSLSVVNVHVSSGDQIDPSFFTTRYKLLVSPGSNLPF